MQHLKTTHGNNTQGNSTASAIYLMLCKCQCEIGREMRNYSGKR